jgi:type 1 fimbriae regulatory protein FimB/type 1 fimbriae regulatory protein FimE
MILMAFRHGLRVSELIALRWDMIDLDAGLVHVTRLKHGVNAPHPLRGAEIRALRRVKREYPNTPYIFVSERGHIPPDLVVAQ